MASTNKKFPLNLTSTGRYLMKRFNGSQENISPEMSNRRPSNCNNPSPTLLTVAGCRPQLMETGSLQRSTSATDIVVVEPEADSSCDVDNLPALTQNIRILTQALTNLKSTIQSMNDVPKETVQMEAHDKLGAVMSAMSMALNRFPSLRSSDILKAVQLLISKVDDCDFDGSSHCTDEINRVIDDLALIISNSVSDCLVMGECDPDNSLTKAKSLSCLTPSDGKSCEHDVVDGRLNHGGHDMDVLDDSVLYRLESGVEVALLRAQAWSKYSKELASYVERRINLWGDFTRGLLKLAKSVEQMMSEDSFLPLQPIFCTALNQDVELASMSQAARSLILNQTFITTLNTRRTEHDKIRKNLKYVWTKQVRKLHDAISNLRKAKTTYISRQQDYEKMKEMALKAECESQSLSASGGTNAAKADAKMEKKKKQEDEAMQKAIEAETAYKHCVRDANEQQKQLEQVKCTILCETKDLLIKSDAVLKECTCGYFKLMNTIIETSPQQFQMLFYNSQQYSEGSHYMEFIHQLQLSDYAPAEVRSFVFEPYVIKSSDPADIHNESLQEGSKVMLGLSKGDDSDSISGGSTLSLESSPTMGSYQQHHKSIVTSSSMAELVMPAAEEDHARSDITDEAPNTFRGVRLSLDAQTHLFRKLRTPSKCVHCDSLIYLQGAECEKCGVASHKKCLEVMRVVCSDQQDATRGGLTVNFDSMIHRTPPYLIAKCIEEIDRRGLGVKGIYRVSGVKSRVEQVCLSFETHEANVDLSDQSPNVIANVLKLFLRQMREPLLTFRLYEDFVQLAKQDEVQGSTVGQLLSSLKQLVEQLPIGHQKTCNILMHHLSRVSRNHEVNQMTSTNLGIVFGPTLLRPKEGAASLNYLIETPYQTRIVEFLIENAAAIFGPDEWAATQGNFTDVSRIQASNIRQRRLTATENTSGSTSPGYASWYAPEITEDLLKELAKEEPHFLQLQEGRGLSPDFLSHFNNVAEESDESRGQAKQTADDKVLFM